LKIYNSIVLCIVALAGHLLSDRGTTLAVWEWKWEGMGITNGNGKRMKIKLGWTCYREWEWEGTIGNGRKWEDIPAHLYYEIFSSVPNKC